MTTSPTTPPRRAPLRRKFVLLTTGATALGVVVLTLLTQFFLETYTKSAVDAALDSQVGDVVAQVRVSADGRLEVPPRAIDTGTAVYDSEGTLVGGAAPGSLLDTFVELSTTDTRRSVEHNHVARVLGHPFDTGKASGVVVTSAPLAPYERAEQLALVVSAVAGLLMVGATAVVAAVVSRRALSPVEEMAGAARQWSEHDLGQRFPLAEPANELSSLGATLNLLLDRVAQAIRSEQRLTSELAHELRTPLTAIRGSVDLLLMREDLDPEGREDLEAIRDASVRMTDTINGLIDLARTRPGELGEKSDHVPVAEVVAAVLAALPGGDRVTTAVGPSVGVRAPRALVERALSPVVANALRHGTAVEVAARDEGSSVVITVTDDGPGVAPDLRDHLFEPGVTSGDGSGAGLGLALARRLARSVGGDVVLDRAAHPTRFAVRLPS